MECLASSGCWVADVVCGSAVFSLVFPLTWWRAVQVRISSLRTWRCLRFRPRQSATDSSCTTEACTYGANCVHSAVLGQVVHAPVVMLRRVLAVGQCRKTGVAVGAVLGGY